MNPLLAALEAAAALDGETVGVWLSSPELMLAYDGEAFDLLSAAERSRYAGFHSASDQMLYLGAHALLRRIVAACLDCEPAAVVFGANAWGRPEVVSPSGAGGLYVSLSHTAGRIAVAASRAFRCGVDVEWVRDSLDLQLLGEALCSATEARWFQRLGPYARQEAFFGLWTIKEALLKAAGVGIASGLSEITLLSGWSDPRMLVLHTDLPGLGEGWQVMHGMPDPACSLALAFERGAALRMPTVRLWDLRSGGAARGMRELALPVIPLQAWRARQARHATAGFASNHAAHPG